MVWSNAKLHLCSDAGDKTHCLHGNCNTLDGCSSFESLDSLYPQVSAKHRWRLHCCLCYQGIIYDVISLCLSLYNHTTETSNCLCKFCSPWSDLIWSEHDKRYFTSYHWKLQWLCTGKYGPVEHESKRTFPIPAILLGLGWLSNVISAIMVYIQRRKLERLEGFAILSLGLSKKYPNKIPRSLESLIGNCSICGLVLVLAILSFKIK